MNHRLLLFSCIAIGLHTTAQQPPRAQTGTHKTAHKPRTFTVDDFPVTDKMFGHCNSCEIASGPLRSDDMIWFTNNQLGQTLVVLLYTDYFRNAFYLFRNDDIPPAMIDSIELNVAGGDTASDAQKHKYFRGFLRWAKPVAPKYFISDKGFTLGDSSAKAIRIYGKPDKRTLSKAIEVLSWTFVGESSYDGKTNLHGRPLAGDSFGHEVTMYFRNDRLIGLIYGNDIP